MSHKRRRLRASFIVVTAGAGAAAIAAACATACSSSSTNASSSPDASSGGHADGPVAMTCPATPPQSGDLCSGTLACTYDAGMYCGSWLTTSSTCATGTWLTAGTAVSCNPGLPTPDASDDAGDGASDAGASSDGGDDSGDAGD